MKKPRIEMAKILSEIQYLIGKGLGAYKNDRNPNRAESVTVPLQKAFDLIIDLRGKKYKK